MSTVVEAIVSEIKSRIGKILHQKKLSELLTNKKIRNRFGFQKFSKIEEINVPGKNNNIVYIGNKPINAYILACVTQFTEGAEEIVLKARGRAISRAVDVAEILRNKFMPDSIELVDVSISTETIEDYERGKTNVSAMEIQLRKKPPKKT